MLSAVPFGCLHFRYSVYCFVRSFPGIGDVLKLRFLQRDGFRISCSCRNTFRFFQNLGGVLGFGLGIAHNRGRVLNFGLAW